MTALLVREIRIAIRAGGGAMTGVLFFLCVIAVFPFAVGPDTKLLSKLAPAILWIGALLASLLGLDRLFAQDREEFQPGVICIGAAIRNHTGGVIASISCSTPTMRATSPPSGSPANGQ